MSLASSCWLSVTQALRWATAASAVACLVAGAVPGRTRALRALGGSPSQRPGERQRVGHAVVAVRPPARRGPPAAATVLPAARRCRLGWPGGDSRGPMAPPVASNPLPSREHRTKPTPPTRWSMTGDRRGGPASLARRLRSASLVTADPAKQSLERNDTRCRVRLLPNAGPRADV